MTAGRWMGWVGALLLLLAAGCGRQSEVELRKFPYPYRAALAISSDIDETDSREEFLEIEAYLCTRDSTRLGLGLGLEMGNSFWFYDWTGRSSFTYFEGTTAERSADAHVIDLFVRAGYIDVLHSWGDFSEGGFRRDLADPCTDVLHRWRKAGHPIRVWVNHGNQLNRQALGGLPYQRGDDPGAPEYHMDLLLPTGIEYVGIWEVTHVVGQERRHRLRDWAKDGASGLAYLFRRVRGKPQTRFRFRNDLMRVATLGDGSRVLSFRRFISPGRFEGADVWNLPEQLSPEVLEELKAREGYMILYTHLGGNEGLDEFLSPEARRVLRVVASEYRAGEIFVTMTSRLLDYCRMHRALQWRSRSVGDSTTIDLLGVDDPLGRWREPVGEFLQGITFYVPRAGRTAVLLGGDVIRVVENPPDRTGRESVSVPWRKRPFPAIP